MYRVVPLYLRMQHCCVYKGAGRPFCASNEDTAPGITLHADRALLQLVGVRERPPPPPPLSGATHRASSVAWKVEAMTGSSFLQVLLTHRYPLPFVGSSGNQCDSNLWHSTWFSLLPTASALFLPSAFDSSEQRNWQAASTSFEAGEGVVVLRWWSFEAAEGVVVVVSLQSRVLTFLLLLALAPFCCCSSRMLGSLGMSFITEGGMAAHVSSNAQTTGVSVPVVDTRAV